MAALVRLAAQLTHALRREALLESPYLSFRPVAADFAAFFSLLLGSPEHVPNPYTRGELALALAAFVPARGDPWWPVPAPADETGGGAAPRVPADPPPLHLHLVAADAQREPALCGTVRSLLSLYTTIGHTGRLGNHRDKLPFRAAIVAMLECLVSAAGSPHCAALAALAADARDGPGLVSDFLNEFINDADFYLDEAVKLVGDVKDDVGRVQRGEARVQHPDRERPGRFLDNDALQRSWLRGIRFELRSAGEQLRVLALLATASDGVTHALLSRRLRARTARFLNSLANTLLGPRRAALRLPPELMQQAGFRPRDLLVDFAAVLGRVAAAGPRCGAEPGEEGGTRWASRDGGTDAGPGAAVAGDDAGGGGGGGGDDASGGGGGAGSGDDLLAAALVGANAFLLQNFAEAPRVLLDPRQAEGRGHAQRLLVQRLAAQLQWLHRRLEVEGGRAAELADLLGELPDACMDPITADLLEDPVLLPASRQIMHRPAILQQLLVDAQDPFTRTPLAAADLVELPRVRDAVRAWVAAKRAGGSGEAEEAAVARERAAAEEAAKAKK